MQKYKNKWHPMAYFSQKMSSAEQNYKIKNKKLLAIVTSFKEWKIYCNNTINLNILTNHKNLFNFITIKKLNQQQMR